MSKLSGDMIRHKLPTYTFGQNVIYTEQIGSTNSELKKLARQGAPEGLLYIAELQTEGRGRMARAWHAPAESSLLTSLLFKPGDALLPAEVQQITMLCSLAMADAIQAETDLVINLKWPNDLVWHNFKKLGGVLTEIERDQTGVDWVVVGLGLNVNINFNQATLDNDSSSPDLAQIATSLSMILGRDTDDLRLPLLQRYLANVEQRYDALKQGTRFHQAWGRRLIGLGHHLTVVEVDGTLREGTMVGIDEQGAILLKQADGEVVKIIAGDVSIRRR